MIKNNTKTLVSVAFNDGSAMLYEVNTDETERFKQLFKEAVKYWHTTENSVEAILNEIEMYIRENKCEFKAIEPDVQFSFDESYSLL